MRQSGEPSVEEILDSIKKVIARDNRAGAEAERRHRESSGVVVATPFADEHVTAHHEVLDLSEVEHFEEDECDAMEPESGDDAPPLVAESAQNSMRESLAALAMLAEPGAQPQIVRSGETSLEGMARELLRPALAEWLDSNLPPMVERLVAEEIARIVGKRG